MLLTGWLASKLGWEPRTITDGKDWTARFDSSAGPVLVTWREGETASPGHLVRLQIVTEGRTFQIERLHGEPDSAIRTGILTDGGMEHGPAYTGFPQSPSDLLMNALDIRKPFRDYEEALHAIAALETG